SVALVGEGTSVGPQALVYSVAAAGATPSNTTWDDRTLRSVRLVANPVPTILDTTRSHYAILSGGRTLDDDPNDSN
ncbi:MAG: hypothetical protein ACYTED_18700, partial [Planctomycetota bacterium]